MRYAIISDLHANLQAWKRVLADLLAEGVDEIVCLGDVVGYGPNPVEVLHGVREVTRNFVIGNHDAAAAGMMDYSIFNEHARQAIEWTMTALDAEAIGFLASIPLAIETDEILFVHAEVAEPGRFDYIDSVEMARQNFRAGEHFVTFVGHTHYPKIFERNERGRVRELADESCTLDAVKRYIVNVGSVGEPRNGDDLRARYVIYNSETREVDFRRVEFDIVAYRNDLEATSLTLRPYFLRVYEQVVEGREVVESYSSNMVDMRVTHGSAALVDLGRVSGMVRLASPSEILRKEKKSLVPVIVGAAALIALMIWGIASLGAKKTVVAEVDPAPKSQPSVEVKEKREMPAPVPMMVAPEEAVVVVEMPEPAIPEESPEVEDIVETAKPKPKPAPVVSIPKIPIGMVWWRMNDDADKGALVDTTGQVSIPMREKGKRVSAVAPDKIPLNQVENPSAIQIGIWEEEKPADLFNLNAASSFTIECWFMCEKIWRPVFLMGTRSGDAEDGRGWHLDLRPPTGGRREGQMSFFYDSGREVRQALAPAVVVADRKSHHVAAVWDHDATSDAGEMRLFLDGTQVAATLLPHKDLHVKQANPFRIGAEGNPNQLTLDELRFTRRALAPHEFLIREEVVGVTLTKSNPNDRDSWSNTANWEGGAIPGKDDSVLIGAGLAAQIEKVAPKVFSGALVLKEKASLVLWSDGALKVLPKEPSVLVMHRDSKVILRTGNAVIGPIELLDRAVFWGGISTSGHRGIRRFTGPISGPGKFILEGVNQNTFEFEVPNSFTGGFEARSTQNQTFVIRVKSDGVFGAGDVTIGANGSVFIEKGVKDAISDEATLTLKGATANGVLKFHLESDETVAAFFVDGKDQGKGVFTSKTHRSLGGAGKLTVVPVRGR